MLFRSSKNLIQAEKGLLMLLDSDLPALKVDFMELCHILRPDGSHLDLGFSHFSNLVTSSNPELSISLLP